MPELPEVETIRRRLAQLLPGKTFADVTINHPKSFNAQPQDLLGQSITKVTRRAKLLQFHLSGGSGQQLVTHLKMTGQLLYETAGQQRSGGGHPTRDWLVKLPSKHTRIEYLFTDGSRLFFNDQRLFGWMRLLSHEEVEALQARLGPDINTAQASLEYLVKKLASRSIPIKTALMTNGIVAGVGNIYACDALNLARISPLRPAGQLSRAEVGRVLAAAQQVIAKGIELEGTTFDGQYVTVDGLAGRYQQKLLAYGRAGEACYNCGHPILKTKLAGRGTYYCGVCQV
ncbi:MAG: DNA-formamidopyrimidine glycosylase [Candidatus Pacebacteria bacterium CG10_big_fil_rev_8_21_14_0_10_56_10]|nr:MAG: DNA-formamidopyrimidine glycosylase [Candidatus Pacebacteria bacterium CG10_big_fil_rev_8_21_14_0_10_56_10]